VYDHIYNWNMARQTVKCPKIKPDIGYAVVLPFPSKSIPPNTVKHDLFLSVTDEIGNEKWPAIPKLLE
jgi:hypothetical protein